MIWLSRRRLGGATPQRAVQIRSFGRRIGLPGASALVAAVATMLIGLSAAPRAAVAEATNVLVVGDSFGNGYHTALVRVARGEPFVFERRSRVSTGLTRDDFYDWPAAIARILDERDYDIVVVSFGANDGQTIVGPSGQHRMGSEGWVRTYEGRVSAFMATLKASGAEVYWIGMPIARSDRMSRKYALMNEIFERQARCHGVTYIETWDRFAVNGSYASHGPTVSGRRRLLRAQDGIHLTLAGYTIIAVELMDALRVDRSNAESVEAIEASAAAHPDPVVAAAADVDSPRAEAQPVASGCP